MHVYTPTPLEQLLEISVNRRQISIGLPKSDNPADRRFPLTPEAAKILVDRGFVVKMQEGGAESIHYTDHRYQLCGVDITDRRDTLRCDIVISLSAIDPIDARQLRRGAMLLTMFDSAVQNERMLKFLVQNNITTVALDMVEDDRGNRPFSDILSEISGRASIAIASSLLADPEHGKGILLGGIAGIVPCEVTVLGSGIDACAAASSAIGLGAMVRMFDNDVYRLRSALRSLGAGVSGSALHPHVLQNALRSADVVIATDLKPGLTISSEVVDDMKKGVIVFDLHCIHPTFPSLPQIDLGFGITVDDLDGGMRPCYVHPENGVPRTAAMALSNSLLTMLNDFTACDGSVNAMMLNRGMQKGALTFMGKPVNVTVARLTGLRHVDIKLILQFS